MKRRDEALVFLLNVAGMTLAVFLGVLAAAWVRVWWP